VFLDEEGEVVEEEGMVGELVLEITEAAMLELFQLAPIAKQETTVTA